MSEECQDLVGKYAMLAQLHSLHTLDLDPSVNSLDPFICS